MKHSGVAGKIEHLVDEPEQLKSFIKKTEAEESFIDLPLPVQVLSGDFSNLTRVSKQSDDNTMKEETICLNICTKYKEMCAMASRTLLVDSTTE